jgi:hypothetical protein
MTVDVAALLVLATDPAPGPYVAGLIAGFALGGFGHLIKSTPTIVAGIILIVIVTALFIAATDPSLGG